MTLKVYIYIYILFVIISLYVTNKHILIVFYMLIISIFFIEILKLS